MADDKHSNPSGESGEEPGRSLEDIQRHYASLGLTLEDIERHYESLGISFSFQPSTSTATERNPSPKVSQNDERKRRLADQELEVSIYNLDPFQLHRNNQV